jgi:hypothetical protein
MRLYVKGSYSNPPAGMYFAAAGWVEVDEKVAQFLLRDAPENFSTEGPVPEAKAPDEPAKDKQVKSPPRKKAAKSE